MIILMIATDFERPDRAVLPLWRRGSSRCRKQGKQGQRGKEATVSSSLSHFQCVSTLPMRNNKVVLSALGYVSISIARSGAS